MLCWFPLLTSLPLPSATPLCLSLPLPLFWESRNFLAAVRLLSLKNISNRPAWLGLVSGLVALIVLNQHSPAQLGKCPIYSSILSTLSSTTILQFFLGLKKSEPKDQNFLLPPVMGLYDFTLHKAFLLYLSQEISGSPQWALWGHLDSPPWPSPVGNKNKANKSKHLHTHKVDKIYSHDKLICALQQSWSTNVIITIIIPILWIRKPRSRKVKGLAEIIHLGGSRAGIQTQATGCEMLYYSNPPSPIRGPGGGSPARWQKVLWFWQFQGTLALPADVTLPTAGVGRLLGALNPSPHPISPLLIQHGGEAPITSLLWVKGPGEMGQFHPGGRKGNDSDHEGKFLKAGQIQVGHRGTQESFLASGIWYEEQPHVTDKPPELTSQDLGSTSRISACWLCYLGKNHLRYLPPVKVPLHWWQSGQKPKTILMSPKDNM